MVSLAENADRSRDEPAPVVLRAMCARAAVRSERTISDHRDRVLRAACARTHACRPGLSRNRGQSRRGARIGNRSGFLSGREPDDILRASRYPRELLCPFHRHLDARHHGIEPHGRDPPTCLHRPSGSLSGRNIRSIPRSPVIRILETDVRGSPRDLRIAPSSSVQENANTRDSVHIFTTQDTSARPLRPT